MKRLLLVAALVAFSSGSAVAYEVLIDHFDAAVNTSPPLLSVAGAPQTATDTGLAGVLGGSRALLVQGVAPVPIITESGVIAAGLFDYMSNGTGFSRATYDGGGAGLGAAISCAEAIEIVYQDADQASQGIGTAPVQIVVTVNGVPTSQPITAAAGILSFPLAAYAVDLMNVSSVQFEIDGRLSVDADLAVHSVTAVGCEPPETPSPAMGAGPLAVGALMLAGLGLVGVARRRTL